MKCSLMTLSLRQESLSGVPHHACDVYLKKLIEKGYNVAICEQTMDPAMCKGIVPREVIRVVTPGTLIESSMLDETSNNYICAFYMRAKESALCLADICLSLRARK